MGAAFALGAPISLPVTNRKDVLQAHLIVGEHLEEFAEGDGRPSLHANRIVPTHTVWQRDSSERACCPPYRGLEIQPVWVGRASAGNGVAATRLVQRTRNTSTIRSLKLPGLPISFLVTFCSEGTGELVPSVLQAFSGQNLVREGSGERTVQHRI